MFYKCVESCIYSGKKYTRSIVYRFATAPAGDGAAYFELFTGEIKTPAGVILSKGLRDTLYVGVVGWEDMRFPLQSVVINPATSKPDFDFDEVEYLFDDAAVETVVGANQMSHTWKEGSLGHPHVHWVQNAEGVVKWQLEYRFWNSGSVQPDWTTIDTVDAVFPYVSGDLGQISVFPAIDMAGLKSSFNVKMRLSRLGDDEADTMVGDAKFNEFDIHYQMDSWGSGGQRQK